jgi:hypothetical protein
VYLSSGAFTKKQGASVCFAADFVRLHRRSVFFCLSFCFFAFCFEARNSKNEKKTKKIQNKKQMPAAFLFLVLLID